MIVTWAKVLLKVKSSQWVSNWASMKFLSVWAAKPEERKTSLNAPVGRSSLYESVIASSVRIDMKNGNLVVKRNTFQDDHDDSYKNIVVKNNFSSIRLPRPKTYYLYQRCEFTRSNLPFDTRWGGRRQKLLLCAGGDRHFGRHSMTEATHMHPWWPRRALPQCLNERGTKMEDMKRDFVNFVAFSWSESDFGRPLSHERAWRASTAHKTIEGFDSVLIVTLILSGSTSPNRFNALVEEQHKQRKTYLSCIRSPHVWIRSRSYKRRETDVLRA